jgi:hypothetical protein
MAGASWLMPSGKIRIARPSASASSTARNASRLREGSAGAPAAAMSFARWSGTNPTAVSSHRSTGFAKSVAFPVSVSRRGSARPITRTSMSAFGWFAATMSGPAAGTRSSPTTGVSR